MELASITALIVSGILGLDKIGLFGWLGARVMNKKDCPEDESIQELELKVAVIEERLNNELQAVARVEKKIDEVLICLLK